MTMAVGVDVGAVVGAGGDSRRLHSSWAQIVGGDRGNGGRRHDCNRPHLDGDGRGPTLPELTFRLVHLDCSQLMNAGRNRRRQRGGQREATLVVSRSCWQPADRGTVPGEVDGLDAAGCRPNHLDQRAGPNVASHRQRRLRRRPPGAAGNDQCRQQQHHRQRKQPITCSSRSVRCAGRSQFVPCERAAHHSGH